MTLPEMKTVRGSVFLSRMGDPALGRSTAPPEWGSPLRCAGVSEFGDDLLAHHLAAVIDDFNQAGARGAGIGHNRGEFRAGKQANNLPFVLGTLDPKLVLFPLCHL